MTRILFHINYDIHPEKRDEYLSTIRELEEYIKSHSSHNYMVVEDKNKPNNFTEIYLCKDETEFDELEDEMDDTIYGLTTKIAAEFAETGKTKYSTFYEV